MRDRFRSDSPPKQQSGTLVSRQPLALASEQIDCAQVAQQTKAVAGAD